MVDCLLALLMMEDFIRTAPPYCLCTGAAVPRAASGGLIITAPPHRLCVGAAVPRAASGGLILTAQPHCLCTGAAVPRAASGGLQAKANQATQRLGRLPHITHAPSSRGAERGEYIALTSLMGFLYFVPTLLSIFARFYLPFSFVSLVYFILAIPMRKCAEEHSCKSSIFYSYTGFYFIFLLPENSCLFWKLSTVKLNL